MAAIAYQITVSRLRHYPVKGFKGRDLDRARLEAGGGVAFDRHLALLVPPLPDLTATDRGRLPYMYLSRNPELAHYRVAWEGSSFRFIAPNGESAAIDLANGADSTDINRALARWFAKRPGGPPQIALQRPDGGYWDFTDTALSVINLATVRDIAQTAGGTIDPLRFRANIYIDGLPAWREFDLVGRTIKAGSARLDILRGIARCNATSIDPVTDEVDMNMPVHLRQTYGHIFCGVYARVSEGGDIQSGDAATVAGDYGTDPYAIRATTSRPPQEWPRFARIAAREKTAVGLTSNLGCWPLLPPEPDSVLRVHPVSRGTGGMAKVPLLSPSNRAIYWAEVAEFAAQGGDEILISGPFAGTPGLS